MANLLDVIKYMDNYICKKMCANYKTTECWWVKVTNHHTRDGKVKIEINEDTTYRRVCYKFRCKHIHVMADELSGGVPCTQYCPVWFICNMFKNRIQEQYQDYVIAKERLPV